MKKRIEIIKTETPNGKCYRCNGKGCSKCDYTGIYKHSYYHIIDNEKKIAFGMDTLK